MEDQQQDIFHRVLRKYWGYGSFRPLQLEAIGHVSRGEDTLVLMPTGGGKSLIYQVPTLAGEGLCIVVTPLISLMKDQVDTLRRKGILARAIHSGVSSKEIDLILDNCIYGGIRFLYISPERIDSELFRTRLAKMNVSILAVDEAHCISQWGYDFRPSYLGIKRIREIVQGATVLALTASATEEVAGDIMRHLGFEKPNILRMSFSRPNLSYIVRRTEDKNEQLLRIVNNVPGCGIVYVRTREMTQTVADFLSKNGITAGSYHGGMNYAERTRRQDAWRDGSVRVMVATNAFGMGIDKADVRFVIHYDICDSLEAYYQEAGRAGRDGRPAYAVTLLSPDGRSKAQRRMTQEFPPLERIKEIYEAIFNYLQIGIGDGKYASVPFSIGEFCSRHRIFPLTAINAIRILQANGYMQLTDETDNPTRIMFIVGRDDLYKIRIDRRDLDHIIKILLRQYSGLFSHQVAIDEKELAYLSGYTQQHIHELFKRLWQLRVIKYIPGQRSRMLILSTERLPKEDVFISPESYNIRKQVAQRRIDAMLEYIDSTDTCRSLIIQRYFGEKEAADCGRCDICRSRRNAAMNTDTLREELTEKIRTGDHDVRTLLQTVKCDPDKGSLQIREMMEEGKIFEDKDGILHIKG